MHFADNGDESKNCLPTWHMGFCKLERESGERRQERGRESASDMDAERLGLVGDGELGRVRGMGRKAKIKHSSMVLVEHV